MSQIQLFRSRRFLPFFATQFLGAFNDNLFKNALVMLVTFRSQQVLGIPPEQMVAVAGGLFILPFFLFSAQSGQLADRYEKSALIRWTKVAEVCIMVLGAVGFLTQRYELLVGVLFLMGLQSTVFGPVKFSILPQLLNKDELVGGNALVEAGTFLAILLGTIAGGVLALWEPHGLTVVSAAVVAVACLGWLTARSIPNAGVADANFKVRWSPVGPTLQILKDARETKSVFLSILAISWFWFFGGFLLSVFPAYCKDFLRGDSHVATLFLALFSIGISVGSLLCERLSRHHLELGLVPLGSLGMSLFALDLFFLGKPAFSAAVPVGEWITVNTFFAHGSGLRVLGDLFGMAVFGGFFIVPLYTFIQTRSKESHRSRIIAANNILNSLFMVGSSVLLVGMMRLNFTLPQMFLAIAVLNALVAVYVYSVIPEFMLRFLVWGLANCCYRLRIRGLQNIPKEGPAVLVANHVSFVDWMIIAAAVKRPVRFIMDHGFAKGFLMKRLVKQAKIIPIASAKVDPQLMEQAFEKAAAELRDGEIVCIFPEGKITKDGKMNAFRPGIERMIRQTPVPVIPIGILNMWGSLFSRKDGPALKKAPRRFWAHVGLEVGTPVPAPQVTAALLQQRVAELIGEPYTPTADTAQVEAR